MADIDKVLSLIPGKPKMNLHASYAIFENGEWADRDRLKPKHFQKWVKFCKERGLGCDFNPTFFSHPNCDPLTLSSPNEKTRRFWIEHGKACIRISSYLAEELGEPCIMNIWTGDGFKDIPADRMGPRVLQLPVAISSPCLPRPGWHQRPAVTNPSGDIILCRFS